MEAWQLAHRVLAIAGLRFDVYRLQQPDFVVVAQGSNRDLSKRGKLTDFEHEMVVKPHATGESRGCEKSQRRFELRMRLKCRVSVQRERT
jgi:hypothetical protein